MSSEHEMEEMEPKVEIKAEETTLNIVDEGVEEMTVSEEQSVFHHRFMWQNEINY